MSLAITLRPLLADIDGKMRFPSRFWTLPTGKPDIPMPPKDSKPDLSTLERYTGTFWALAYGQLHIFRPNALPADLPQSAALKLGLIKKARVFGPATERQPDLLAVYENDSFVIGCVAMYAVGPSTFWSHNNELADLSRVPTAKTDDVVAMPHSVRCLGRIEYAIYANHNLSPRNVCLPTGEDL